MVLILHVFEIFTVLDLSGNVYLTDDTIVYHVYGDSHYTIITFDSDKIDGSQFTKSIIQFTSDGQPGEIKFQIKYFGSQYNKNIRFLFYSRVVKGKQSTSFDHTIFNVSDVQDNHEILYFENINLNGNLIDGLGDPVHLDSATNKKYVDIENSKQNIAIFDKANKSYVDGEIAKVHIDTTPLLPRDGSRSMLGDLDVNSKHILKVESLNDHKVDDAYEVIVKDLKSVVNKEYLNNKFLKKDVTGDYDLKQKIIKNCEPYYDGLFDDNSLVSKAFVDAQIAKLPHAVDTTNFLKLDGSRKMTGDLDLNNNRINGCGRLTMNNDTLSPIEMYGSKILNCGGLTMNNDLNSSISMNNNRIYNLPPPTGGQQPVPLTFGDNRYLKRDGSKAMTNNINMDNHNIINLKDPQPSDASYAASVNFVNKTVNDSNTIMDSIIDKKIKESETRNIESIDKENVFEVVMDNDYFKEDDNDIHKVGVKNKDFHSVNKKTYEFKIDYDSDIGYYSTRLSIDLIYLPIGSYTMVYEMYVDDGITIDQINASSGTISVEKINSTINGTNTRSIIHFTKHTIHSGFDDLDIDIKLKNKSDPQTTIYVVVYGVKGYANNVSVNLWDRLYYYDNDSIKYEAPIDMNGKDITGVNKITTKDLDVNDDIDMKNRQIKNIGDGNENADAVNVKQLNELKTNLTNYANTIDNKITTINTQQGYYYFTNQLRHKNTNTVKFPTINKYPYSANNNSQFLRITLDGHYQIIYTDYYKNGVGASSSQFIIHDQTNGNNLFVTNLNRQKDWASTIINAVIPINVDNGFNHVDIKLYVKSSSFLDGVGNSTFFIKYLSN